ncbi:MAG: hypothetical protein IJD60_07655 [Clostridia bacterium]|nr:hypothetical protein [Clostridia bacterium]
MAVVSCALALLSGVIGAGFASGREIVCFFAGHGRAAGAAVVCALLTLHILFLCLPAALERSGCTSLPSLCRVRFGRRLGALCGGLFFALFALTGGAMLAACAELCALTFPFRHAYGAGLALSLLFASLLSLRGAAGLALPGAALCAVLPALLISLLALPAGEACFLPAMTPGLPVRAALDGAAYSALNAAMLGGSLPLLLSLSREKRRQAVTLFSVLFGALLTLGMLVCRRHLPSVFAQPLPFVALSRRLGLTGYFLCAAAMYAAAFSTLTTMLLGLTRMLPLPRPGGCALCALVCLCAAQIGFGPLIESGYPVLGALCAGLMLLLCLPSCPQSP